MSNEFLVNVALGDAVGLPYVFTNKIELPRDADYTCLFDYKRNSGGRYTKEFKILIV